MKNKHDGERLVGLSDPVVDALDTYLVRKRFDRRDEHGRSPLFSGRQGRPTFTTLRAWAYLGTQPCLYQTCPHGKERQSCEFVHRNHASKCPSSRSPHPIRTGSITWQLNQGLDVGTVATEVWTALGPGEASLAVADDAPTVLADEMALRRMFENVLGNSLEHGPDDVPVRVGGLDADHGFYVEDGGPGIPEDEREDVFRAGFTTTEGTDGNGTGLASAKQIAMAHGWRIRVSGERDARSRYSVRVS